VPSGVLTVIPLPPRILANSPLAKLPSPPLTLADSPLAALPMRR
jgi:hypothetical protein